MGARHKFGCRVLERMIEHFPACRNTFPHLVHFLDDLLERAASHMFHAFATHVMQHIMEHGSQSHKKVIFDALRSDLEKAAMDPHACGVLDKALSFMPVEDQCSLAGDVLTNDGLLARMALSEKPAAAQLLRVVRGAQREEAQRQLSALCNDDATRTKLCRTLSDGRVTKVKGDGMVQEFEELMAPRSQTMGARLGVDVSVTPPQTLGLEPPSMTMEMPWLCTQPAAPSAGILLAPQPMSMGGSCVESYSVLSVPSQMSMTNVAPSPSTFDDDSAWWSTTVNQVFALWSNDQLSHEPWDLDTRNHQWS